MQSWPLNTPRRTGIHDLAPAPDGGVWFTAQRSAAGTWAGSTRRTARRN
jgi:virginiamycin B lyase